ncbi:tyrosinase cofactor [Kitasatospora kazusensis]|uniref:Tyrosinase cofactor n=1 Tax=Kitasatospora kazusensis TaxID=407974 RepID=A0ABN3A2L6_9ACTN
MSESSRGSDLTRRRMLQGAAVALTAAAGTALIGLTGPTDRPAAAAGLAGSDEFDEVYQGRRIQGRPVTDGAAAGHHHGGGYAVLIDGRPLHMMRNSDGTWISVVNHYQTFTTPRGLARAAVNELQGATLV